MQASALARHERTFDSNQRASSLENKKATILVTFSFSGGA